LPVKHKDSTAFDEELIPPYDLMPPIEKIEQMPTMRIVFFRASREYKEAVHETLNSLRHCRSNDFKTCTDTSPMIVPLIPVIGQILMAANWSSYKQNLKDSFPKIRFNQSIKNLEKKMNAIPSQIDKKPLKRFSSDAQMAYHMLLLRYVFRLYVNSKISELKVNDHLAEFNRVAKQHGWEDHRIDSVKQALQDSPLSNDIDSKIMGKLQVRAHEIEGWLNRVEEEISPFNLSKRLPGPPPPKV
jgi:hypothetical protein